ncbi:MAG: hypothetical protein ABIQ93_15105, partial [Saprospiraceae bacterium]
MNRLFILFLLLLGTASASAQWKILNNWAETPAYRLRQQNGLVYTATDAGLFRSADQGLHWDKFKTLPPAGYRQLAIGVSGNLYTVGWSGYDRLWESADDGVTWQEVPMPPGVVLDYNYVYAFETVGSYLFVVANTGILRRPEGGGNWEIVPAPVATPTSDLVTNGIEMWVAQHTDTLYHSSDLGQTWDRRPIFPYFSPYRLAVHGNRLIAINQKDYQIKAAAVTPDGGLTWQIAPTPEVFEQIDYGIDRFWALDVNGQVWQSADGLSWQAFPYGNSSYSWSPPIVENGVWLISAAPGILRSTDSGGHWNGSNTGFGTHPGQVSSVDTFLMAIAKHISTDEGDTWLTPLYPSGRFSNFWKYNNQYYAMTDAVEGLFRSDGDLMRWTQIQSANDLELPLFSGPLQLCVAEVYQPTA